MSCQPAVSSDRWCRKAVLAGSALKGLVGRRLLRGRRAVCSTARSLSSRSSTGGPGSQASARSAACSIAWNTHDAAAVLVAAGAAQGHRPRVCVALPRPESAGGAVEVPMRLLQRSLPGRPQAAAGGCADCPRSPRRRVRAARSVERGPHLRAAPQLHGAGRMPGMAAGKRRVRPLDLGGGDGTGAGRMRSSRVVRRIASCVCRCAHSLKRASHLAIGV
jgi:hypothetical protein